MNDDFMDRVRESANQTADQAEQVLGQAADALADAAKKAQPKVDRLLDEAASLVKRFRSPS